MQHANTEQFQRWTDFYGNASKRGMELSWPSETLARMMKGNYIDGLNKDYSGKSAIDVGFGSGNNLVFLASLGLDISGIEVTKEICLKAEENLAQWGLKANLQVGQNLSIPFDDETFDVLVSWNVVHYEEEAAGIEKALREYQRVLKPGGRFFLSTVAPDNKIFEGAHKHSDNSIEIRRTDDFRQGKRFFCFSSEKQIQECFEGFFNDVRVGRVRDFLFQELLDWFLVTGLKTRD